MTLNDNNVADFKPSETQKSALEAFQARKYLCTVAEACEAAGLSSRAYYHWFEKCPGFEKWWAAKADLFFARKLPKVKGAVLDAAVSKFDKDAGKYNSKAQELFLQRFDRGFVPRSRSDVEHSGKVSLDWSNMTDADLERMEHTLRSKDDAGSNTDT